MVPGGLLMVSTIDAQIISLIVSVFAGLIIGLLFDLYRTINYYTRPPRAFLYFMDLLFWIITGIVVFIVLLNADFAMLRMYTFAGMALGVFIYIKLFSEYILKFYRGVIYLITKLVRLTFITLLLPFKILYNIMWMPIHRLKNFFKSALLRICRGFTSVFTKPKKKK
jgi:spore cortex biosynthesis protein YabQ